jgi:hypothetical protein
MRPSYFAHLTGLEIRLLRYKSNVITDHCKRERIYFNCIWLIIHHMERNLEFKTEVVGLAICLLFTI